MKGGGIKTRANSSAALYWFHVSGKTKTTKQKVIITKQ